MPFRHNFFGDKIAQPGTMISEIDDALFSKYAEVPSIWGASIYPTGEDDFKFGGRLRFNALDDDDTFVEDMSFDGFESTDDIRAWLTGEIGVRGSDIEVED